MTDHSQIMDSVIATPRASSNGSIFWVTPTQFNPQTGTYQTHYYSDDLVKSGTVSVGTPTWKNNSMVPQEIPSSNVNSKSVAAPILIPPPQSRNLANFEDPVIRIPDGIKELEFEDDDDQSVVDIKQLNQNFDYDSENGDNSNRAKNVVDAVVALGHVLVKDLQKAVPNLKSSGSSIFESCLAGPNISGLENELAFSPKNILRDTLRNNTQVKPHLLPNGVTMQELIASGGEMGNSPDKNFKKMSNMLSSSTLLSSELFFDQNKYPRMSLIIYEPSNNNNKAIQLNQETVKRLNSDFGDSPLCFISLVDCPSELFSTLLLNPDLESSSVQRIINKELSERQQNIANDQSSLVDLYYWYKDEEFIYLLLDFKISMIPKLHDILLILANSISSTVVMNNSGIINQESLKKLVPIMDLQKEFESRQEKIINKLVNNNKPGGINSNNSMKSGEFSTPPREIAENLKDDDFKTAQANPLLLLTPRYKPTLRSETFNDFNQITEQELDKNNINHGTPRALLCTLKTTPRPYLVWLLHDFNFLLYDTANSMILNSIDYFETLMTELGCGYECEDSQITYFENLKLYLRSYYTMKECHTLVSPYTIDNSERKIRMDHMKQIACLRQRLLGISKNHAISHKLGQYNSSLTINRYLSIFFKVLNNNKTENLSELNEIVQRRFCDRILMDVNDYYAVENMKLLESLPMSEAALKDEIKEIRSKCMHLYKEYTSTLIDTDIYIDYKIQLQSELQERKSGTIKENLNISVKYCTTYLNEIAKNNISNKLYNGVTSNNTSFEGLSSKNGIANSRKQYSILDLEKDLDDIYLTMLNSLNDKIPREISLNCFLKVANELRHEWYQVNGGENNVDLNLVNGKGGDKIGIENCFGGNNSINNSKFDDEFMRRMETPEMLVNRLNADLEEIDSEYNGYSLMQKKELLEDILLEATKKKDRLSDFYKSNQLYGLDSLIAAVQDRLDVVNTERKSILDNNEMQRQMILKQKHKRWRKLFPCLKKNINYDVNSMNLNNSSANNCNNIQMNDMNHSVNESY
ncbi:guanylate-binding n-terminal domain containing [Cryptosporidium sp. chipmunk genotype I]|uniref:guanylate-binding n-terminal domain containing n=1 Tax=Cryptosporidium sp. chipmunk genotype I TaxID=1280935 RepID=UPI00351A377B|nr:guanylate-binding n-terminal domain containing [Cryptosporidium sp. chipmunk genotype I]